MGNRALPSATLWPVVLAMEKAFPVLMSPAADAVRRAASSEHLTDALLASMWVHKAGLRTHGTFHENMSRECLAEDNIKAARAQPADVSNSCASLRSCAFEIALSWSSAYEITLDLLLKRRSHGLSMHIAVSCLSAGS